MIHSYHIMARKSLLLERAVSAKFLLSTTQITRNYAHIRNVIHVSQAWLWKVLRKLISQRIARLRTIRSKEDFSKAFSQHEFQFIFLHA